MAYGKRPNESEDIMADRIVDKHLPKWLSSKILSAVDYVWQVRVDNNMEEESKKRLKSLTNTLDGEEMCWVLMLLTLPKINDIIMDSKEAQEFKEMKQAERILH